MSDYGKKVIALLDSNSSFGANLQRMDQDIEDLKQGQDDLEALVNSITDIELPDVTLADFVTNKGTQTLLDTNNEEWSLKGLNAAGSGESKFFKIKNGALNIYHLNDPGAESHAANKKYVDTTVASVSVPVGSIMIWVNSTVPDGWFKLQGGSFSTSSYPLLHAYLQGTAGYTSGKLPNWSGHYPGEYGDHITNALGTKVGAQTGKPAGGAPKSSNYIPNGDTRTFGASGSKNAYSDGASKVTINENWDETTRPKTVIVHYIIKHD